jgi:hypothetical protein
LRVRGIRYAPRPGDSPVAATAAVAARALGGRLTVDEFAGWTPYRDPTHRAHVAAGLRKAGLG